MYVGTSAWGGGRSFICWFIQAEINQQLSDVLAWNYKTFMVHRGWILHWAEPLCSNTALLKLFLLVPLKGWKRSSTVKKLYWNKNQHAVCFPHISHKYSVGFPLHAPPPDALCLLKGDLLTVFTHDLWIISKVMHAACSSVFTTRLTRWPSLCGTALHWWTVTSFSAFSSIWWTTKNEAALYSEKYCFYLFFTGVIFEFHTRTFLLKYVCVIMSVSLCVKVLKLSDMAQKRYANLQHTETQKTATRQRSSWNNSGIQSRHSGYLSVVVPHKHM